MTTLVDIRSKIRRITGRPSVNQISDEEIDNYINTFYQYDLPENVRTLSLKETYTFTTQPNIEVYDFPVNDWYTIETPVYCAGYEIQLYQSPEMFYRLYARLMTPQTVATGSGTTGPFATTISFVPFLRSTTNSTDNVDPNVLLSSVDVDNNPLSAYDTPTSPTSGVFTGDFTGNINYITGAISVNSLTPILQDQAITIQVVPYVASRPQTILFFNNQFRLRPVPDMAYPISMTAYRTPTSLINDSDSPQLNEWWQLLSLGASLKIFEDNAEFQMYSSYMPIYSSYLAKMQRRTLQQIKINKAATIYNSNSINSFGNYFPNS